MNLLNLLNPLLAIFRDLAAPFLVPLTAHPGTDPVPSADPDAPAEPFRPEFEVPGEDGEHDPGALLQLRATLPCLFVRVPIRGNRFRYIPFNQGV
jgi:hypothetical protein